jgi:hypothetical protein
MTRPAIARNAADRRARCLHPAVRHRGGHLAGDDVGAGGWFAPRPTRSSRAQGRDRSSLRLPRRDARRQLLQWQPNQRPRLLARATASAVAAAVGGRLSGLVRGDDGGDGGLYVRLPLRLRNRGAALPAFRQRRTPASLRFLRRQSWSALLRLHSAARPVAAARGVRVFPHVAAPRAKLAMILRGSRATRASDARHAAALVQHAARAADAALAARGGPARYAARSARAGEREAASVPATMQRPDRQLVPTNPRPAAAHCAASRSPDAVPAEGRGPRASAGEEKELPPCLALLPNRTNGWVLVGQSYPSCVR